MFKRIIGIIVFVAVILIAVMAVRERRSTRNDADTLKEAAHVEIQVIPADSARADTVSGDITSEDLIMDMVGIDTLSTGN